MKTLCTFALLGLTLTFEDNEFLARPTNPIVQPLNNLPHKPNDHVFHDPRLSLNTFVSKLPKTINHDDNDNEFFNIQDIEELEDEDVVLAVKFLHLMKKMKDNQLRNIFTDDLEDNNFAHKAVQNLPKKKGNVRYDAESFVGDTVKILQGKRVYQI